MAFRIGDRVRCVRNQHRVKVGETGVIQDVFGESRLFDLAVRWDTYDKFKHDNGGMCESGHGWLVMRSDVELELTCDLGPLPEVIDMEIGFLFGL